MPYRFKLIDVFGTSAFSGNPLAVVADVEALDADAMQQITRWLNLSETAFLLPPTLPEADYRVRIFTLDREMPFAGHPTLGSCHAWLSGGGTPKDSAHVMQECGAGLVKVRRGDAGLAFAAPPLIRSGPVDQTKLLEIVTFLQIDISEVIDAHWVDNGPGWVAILLRSAAAVLALEPARSHSARIDLGIVGPHPDGQDTAFELRAFFSDHLGTIVEDPVTGSLNASVAQWLLATGRAVAPYLASQGTRLGRTGRVQVEQDEDGRVWIGGRTATLFSGESEFEALRIEEFGTSS